MIHSIRQFIEKETYEIEKMMKKFVEGEIDLDLYGKELQERSLNLTKNILEETLESSYRKGGEHASLTDQVSRQAVKGLVHSTIIEMPMEKKEKTKVRHLHIEADEDHVAAQFYEKKGDLQRDRDGRKNNTPMPKLVCVYEDIVEESEEKSKTKRYRLTGKHYFCGLYPGKENGKLWQEVRDYIYENYEWEHLEKIYIAGDGAGWIKSGCDILEKAVFVPDRFHMEKYIQKSVSHLLDSANDTKGEIYSAIKEKDKKEVRKIYRHIVELTEKESKL